MKHGFSVAFTRRATGAPLQLFGAPARVVWFSSAAVGGPEGAELAVSAGEAGELGELFGLVGAAVEIRDRAGRLAWWGYVHEVLLQAGAVTHGLSLEGMFNKVRVSYLQTIDGDVSAGRNWTDYQEDAASVAAFGTKELIYSTWWGTAGRPTDLRARLLNERKGLQAACSFDPQGRGTRGVIRCRGWYGTLGWRYYEYRVKTVVDTSAQIGRIGTELGQFFSGVRVETTSGIASMQYRDGYGTGLDEVNELLALGTSTAGRLLARVDENRVLVVSKAPSQDGAGYLLGRQGEVLDEMGNAVDKWRLKAGSWARVQRLHFGDGARLADAGTLFVERVTYYPAEDRLQIGGAA